LTAQTWACPKCKGRYQSPIELKSATCTGKGHLKPVAMKIEKEAPAAEKVRVVRRRASS
jgi:hypothetical protein